MAPSVALLKISTVFRGNARFGIQNNQQDSYDLVYLQCVKLKKFFFLNSKLMHSLTFWQRLGCDGEVWSNKLIDRCGVCGGDGSNCSTNAKKPQYYWQLDWSPCSVTCGVSLFHIIGAFIEYDAWLDVNLLPCTLDGWERGPNLIFCANRVYVLIKCA